MMSKFGATSTLIFTVAFAAVASAQSGGTSAAQSKKPESGEPFMREAAMSSMAEVVHGKQAQSNAAHDEVRKFGTRMVADHTKVNEELKALAAKKEAVLPPELDEKHGATQQKLEKLKGEEFDRAYMQHMVQAHKQAVTLFENEAKGGKDADTSAFAKRTLPMLQQHLELATQIHAKVSKGGK